MCHINRWRILRLIPASLYTALIKSFTNFVPVSIVIVNLNLFSFIESLTETVHLSEPKGLSVKWKWVGGIRGLILFTIAIS